MKKLSLLTFTVALVILFYSVISIASPIAKIGFDGLTQDKAVKKAKTAALTTGGTKTGGHGQGGSQQDTAVVKPPVRGSKHLDSLRHHKKIKHKN